MTGEYCDLDHAIENSEPIVEAGKQLAESAVTMAARDTGRTTEEQWERMGDRFAYEAAEQDQSQKQLDDYELTGKTVEVVR